MKKISEFRERLELYENKGTIKVFYRGICFQSALSVFKINRESPDLMKKFAEKIFYYGDKPQYFKLEKNNSEKKFSINDTSDEMFKFIFEEFNRLQFSKDSTVEYHIAKNLKEINFFFNIDSKTIFLKKVEEYSDIAKVELRNYLLSFLHRVGDKTAYKKQSLFTSTTTSLTTARNFGKDVVLKFWKPKSHLKVYDGEFKFDDNIYPEENELTLLGGIFPTHLFSFEYMRKDEYYNPNILDVENIDIAIINGLDIDQTDFSNRLPKETLHSNGLTTKNHLEFEEINPTHDEKNKK